jgi:hypothetical protein
MRLLLWTIAVALLASSPALAAGHGIGQSPYACTLVATPTDNETRFYLSPNYEFTNPLQVANRYGGSSGVGTYFGIAQSFFNSAIFPGSITNGIITVGSSGVNGNLAVDQELVDTNGDVPPGVMIVSGSGTTSGATWSTDDPTLNVSLEELGTALVLDTCTPTLDFIRIPFYSSSAHLHSSNLNGVSFTAQTTQSGYAVLSMPYQGITLTSRSTFTGSVKGSALTLQLRRHREHQVRQTLTYSGVAGTPTINSLASGTLGEAGSAYNLSVSPGAESSTAMSTYSSSSRSTSGSPTMATMTLSDRSRPCSRRSSIRRALLFGLAAQRHLTA